MNDSETLDHFIERLRDGGMDQREFKEMERRLLADPAFRREYRVRMRMESGLLSVFQSARPDIAPPLMTAPRGRAIDRRRWIPAVAVGIAAAVAIGFFAGTERAPQPGPPVIARLESSSAASWVQGAPGGIGSPLASVALELREGLAEIRFTSGVLLSLEAPAHIELIDPMRCRLLSGLAVIDVPDGAEGFIVETPEGHAVDHGTRFAVTVDARQNSADFQVLEGRISVHHAASGSALDLTSAEFARLSTAGIQTLERFPSRRANPDFDKNLRRLETHGKEVSVIRHTIMAGPGETLLDPDFLMVKRDDWMASDFPKDRRSLVGFALGEIDPQRIDSARLRLNMVPTGLGFVSSLPETNTFALYGIRDDPSLETWPSEELDWDNAPGSAPDSGGIDESSVRLLATIEIPRGRISGPVVFSSPELTEFIRNDTTGEVGFLILRATPPLDSWSLVHAFATSSHPSAAGPVLELSLEPSGN